MTIDWNVFERFRRPVDQKTVSWAGVTEWNRTVERKRHAERAWLAQRRADSDRLLGDLDGDPTAHDWTSFLLLRRDREEDWSDWLAQLMEDSATGRFAHSLLAGVEQLAQTSYALPAVHREVAYEGFRADLVIEWADASYTHVEVKVGDPSLAKTLDTARQMERRFGSHLRCRSDAVLLVPSQLDAWQLECACTPGMHERVHCLTWLDVSKAVRQSLPQHVGESMRWRVWAHAFCGAIEQDLLRMRSGADPTQWASSLGFQSLSVASRLFNQDSTDAR